ncbi:MAG: DUF1800 domain-containing protein [Acidobacteriota bacterium]
MSYRFFSTSVENLRREGERRARLAAVAAPLASRERTGRPVSPLRRRLGRDFFTPAGQPATVPSPPSAGVIAYSRLAFGPRPGEIDAFNALAGTDPARLQAWVDQQLDPASLDDSHIDNRIAASGFTTLGKTVTQLWTEHAIAQDIPWDEVIRPLRETELVTFLRAIYSRRQLFEVMVDFWHNHFNVYAHEWPFAPMWVHSDRDAIRAHAFGNFRQMIEAVARTPAMLHYLDNAENSFEDANENYARELLELHGLGAEHYFGNIPQGAVPRDAQNRPRGFVEDDVVAAARCLTGWTVSDRSWDPEIGNSGEFLYYDPWHDHDPKHLLGIDLPGNQAPMKDGHDLFDLIAGHPGTARHVAGKIARRLLGDVPPASVVDAAAAVFAAQISAPDQLAQVIRTIVLSPEFLQTWGDKVKRPFEIAVGAFRATTGDIPFLRGDDATNWFYWEYYQTGQPLFGWHPPNGYPDFKSAWNTTAPRVMSWRLANMLIQVNDGENEYFEFLSQMPPDVRSAEAIVTFWTERMLGRPTPPSEHTKLVEFMAQGHNPSFDLPLDTDEGTQIRLRALIALILQSPSFLWR